MIDDFTVNAGAPQNTKARIFLFLTPTDELANLISWHLRAVKPLLRALERESQNLRKEKLSFRPQNALFSAAIMLYYSGKRTAGALPVKRRPL
ncbi:MAG: hypothetical protein HFK10_07270 [Clostridia bacterium]|nr:hypothetical protein [Clostridia bacterium]